MADNAVANGPYTDTVTTLTQMGGVGIGGGCASTEGSAPLGVALVVLAAFGLAVMLRKRGARAAAGVLAVCLAMTLGCAGAPLTYEASPEGTLSAPSVASLSLYDYGSYEGEYAGPSGKKEGGIEAKWAARAGMVLYLGTEVDVPPRLTMGAFARMLETDSTRVEVGIDLTPELGGDSRTNVYGTLSGDFVGFIDDTFYWKAGGGVILEQQDSTNYFLGILEGGAGMWFGVGEENAAVVNVIFQIPLGDANPAMMLAITGAYEF
jgi:MYXO-CTERM domain-containing protein